MTVYSEAFNTSMERLSDSFGATDFHVSAVLSTKFYCKSYVVPPKAVRDFEGI